MIEIKCPAPVPTEGRKIFLGGSIEMGGAPDWQKELTEELKDTDFIFLNPRRDSWDASIEQRIDNPNFKEQVTWELTGLEESEKILLYFAPGTKSPISLLELGLFAHTKKVLVVCPEGFWRKENVDIVCERYGIEQVSTLAEACARLRTL